MFTPIPQIFQDSTRVYETGLRIIPAKFRDRSMTASTKFHRSLRNRFRTNRRLTRRHNLCPTNRE